MRDACALLFSALMACGVALADAHAQPVSRATALASLRAEPLRHAGIADSAAQRDALTAISLTEPGMSLRAGDIATFQVGGGPTDRKNYAPWWAPVASAVVPGTGQLAMGQQRGVAYLVAEVYLVLQSVSQRRDWERGKDEYIAIAADVARRQFGGSLPVGPFEYYEAMQGLLEREGIESGIFDRVPGGAVDPETDEATYNGGRWRIARETYWADPNSPPADSTPEYQKALAEYERTAVRDEYRWSWRDAGGVRDVYRQYIASSNRSYQRSVNMLGLVGVNHLASLIDAYVTTRIRRYRGVRAVGLSLDGIQSGVHAVGDPAERRYRVSSTLRFVPGTR